MVAIKNKPSSKPSSVTTPKRLTGNDKYKMQVTFKIPDRLKNTKYNDRATVLGYSWQIKVQSGTKTDTWKIYKNTSNMSASSSTFNLASISDYKITSRTGYYPVTTKKLLSVTFKIRGKNDKGKGDIVATTRKFLAPRKPTIAQPTHSEDTGRVSAEITTNAGTDYYERYDTRYQVLVYDSRTGQTTTTTDTSSTNTTITASCDPASQLSLLPGQYIKVTFKAWARGFAGDSDVVTRSHIIGYPAVPTISDYSVSSANSDGKVVVNIKTNDSTNRPVDRVRLEALVSTDASTAADATSQLGDWDELDVTDNANSTALVANVADIMPATGKKTWLRVKAWHDFEDVFFVNSQPIRITQLEREAASTTADSCEIVSVVPNGNTAIVTIGWDKSGADSSSGTEVSWSTSEDAWRSTDSPNIYEIGNDWDEGAATGWRKSATLYIKDLDEAQPIYIRARRFKDGTTRTYGAYSPMVNVVPAGAPATVELSAPSSVIVGESAKFLWSNATTKLQKSWRLMTVGGVVIDSGDDFYTSHAIPYERLAEAASEETETIPIAGSDDEQELEIELSVGQTFTISSTLPEWSHTFNAGDADSFTESGYGSESATFSYDGADTLTYELPEGFSAQVSLPASGNKMGVYVAISTGGDWVNSEAVNVRLVEAPTLTLTVPSTLTAQPLSFSATTNANIAQVVFRVYSNGASGSYPDGDRIQADGDTIYSAVVEPTWSNGAATITLPEQLEFIDGAVYTVEAVLTDGESGLSTDVQSGSLTVSWSHKDTDDVSLVPPDTIRIVGSTQTDTDGDTARIATITLAAPEDALETDVYDIYRLSKGKASLIASDIALDGTVVDTYAPFGLNTRYRIALRTVDGYVEWADFDYLLECNYVRFDFDGRYFEYPYQLSISNSYTKDFELKRKMDGSMQGYWNAGTEHNASFTSDMVSIADENQLETVFALAEYPGAVFIRKPDGTAYTANVEVRGFDSLSATSLVTFAFDAVEVELTDDFIVQIAEEEDE